MALHVSEMGIQIKVGEQNGQSAGEACDEDGDEDATQQQQEQLVTATVRRVLEILKARGAR